MKMITKGSRKLALLIFAFVFVLSVSVGIGLNIAEAEEGSMQTSFVGSEVTFDATKIDDFYLAQEEQGDKNWYIYGGSIQDGYSVLYAVGDKYGQSGSRINIWKNDDGSATWNGIWWRSEFHNFGGLGVVAVWKAPTTGTVKFTGKIENVALGSGYDVNVYKKGAEYELLYTATPTENFSVNLSGAEIALNKNEQIIFEMKPHSTAESKCKFYVKPTFVSAGVDEADPKDEYEKRIPGLNDTVLDNEYYKYSLDGMDIPDAELSKYYSDKQGENGIYYFRGDIYNAYGYMNYREGKWNGEMYQIITSALDYTTGENGNDTMVAFRPNSDGLLDAFVREKNGSYTQEVGSSDFDGVKFSILIKRYNAKTNSFSAPEELFVRDVGAGEYINKTSKLTLKMKAGDMVILCVNAKKTNWCDHYTIMSDFNYIPSGETVELPEDLGTEPNYGEYTQYYTKKQGDNGWYYAYGSVENGYYLMDYNVYQDYWENPLVDTFTRILSVGLHAGYNNEEAILIKRLDCDGRIKVVTYWNLHSTQGDGILIDVWHNREKLHQVELDNSKVNYFVSELEVKKGDTIILSMGNKMGNTNSFDMTTSVLSVEYIEKTSEPIIFTDDNVGQLSRDPLKPDDKLTEMDIPKGNEVSSNGCGSSVSGCLLTSLLACALAVNFAKRKERSV